MLTCMRFNKPVLSVDFKMSDMMEITNLKSIYRRRPPELRAHIMLSRPHAPRVSCVCVSVCVGGSGWRPGRGLGSVPTHVGEHDRSSG